MWEHPGGGKSPAHFRKLGREGGRKKASKVRGNKVGSTVATIKAQGFILGMMGSLKGYGHDLIYVLKRTL